MSRSTKLFLAKNSTRDFYHLFSIFTGLSFSSFLPFCEAFSSLGFFHTLFLFFSFHCAAVWKVFEFGITFGSLWHSSWIHHCTWIDDKNTNNTHTKVNFFRSIIHSWHSLLHRRLLLLELNNSFCLVKISAKWEIENQINQVNDFFLFSN